MFAIQLDHVAGFTRADSHQTTPTREHIDLACKLARAQAGHEFLSGARGPDNIHLTFLDDEEPRGEVTGFHEDLTTLDLTRVPMGSYARDLRRRQRRKYILDTGANRQRDCRSRIGHFLYAAPIIIS
jgi:hypothetical protein